MPELPEVETVARELNRKLKNKTIKMVEVLHGKMVALGPGAVSPKRQAKSYKVIKFAKLLWGQKIRSVARRAKLLIFDFYRLPGDLPLPNPLHRGEGTIGGVHVDGSLALLVHLKMTGQFIYFRKPGLNKQVRVINKKTAPLHRMPAKYTHVVFTFTDGSKLFYNDVRQFGYFKLVKAIALPKVAELQELGPEPLSKDFTMTCFITIVIKHVTRKLTIKQLLMDPKFIAGIGNIYSDEILFRAKVAPSRLIKTLKPGELRRIYHAIPFILKKAIAAHGSSVGDFIRTDGAWGTMGKYHFVYGRAGKPCKVCGTTIKSAKFNGRTGSFCPRCQK